MSIFTKEYWRLATKELSNVRTLALAGVLIALRVAIKSLYIPLGPDLNVTFGFFVNALGAMSFGPVVAFIAAIISDTLGVLLTPQNGAYFLPFVFVEIAGSVIFALMLYRQKLSSTRIIVSRFLVALVCNIILNPLILLLYHRMMTGNAYAIFSMPRVLKNIALFPIESLLLVLFIGALVIPMGKMKFIRESEKPKLTARHFVFLGIFFLIAIAVVIIYYRYLTQFKFSIKI